MLQSVIEICQRLLEIADEEVRDALLEVCHCKVIVPLQGSLVALDLNIRQSPTPAVGLSTTHGLVVFTECGMYDTTVEQYL